MPFKRIAKVVLIIVFVGLIAIPVVLRRLSARREKAMATADAQSAITRYGLHFEEVSKAAGINFVHQAPTLDHKLDHARVLLDSAKFQVNEVAYQIGYTNPSHFIASFKKKFGVTPKKYLMGREAVSGSR